MKKKISSIRRIAAVMLALMLVFSAVSAGFVSAEETVPTYEVFGETLSYDLTSGALKVSDTTLEDGTQVIETAVAGPTTLTLAENVQDFKLSFKFKNGNITDSSGNIQPVFVTMRGAYYFANPKYNVSVGDMYFSGGGETERRINGGGSTSWHSVEITMKGSSVVIIYDGVIWYETTLIKGATSGALKIDLKYIGTKIADLKVETPTDEDIAAWINADFSTSVNTAFSNLISGSYDAAEKAFGASGQTKTLALTDSVTGTEYMSVYNYVFETEFKISGISGEQAYQRGILIQLPSGNTTALFTESVRNAEDSLIYTSGSNNLISKSLQDGEYHKVKIESVNDTEAVYLDGELIHTFEVASRTSGNITLKFDLNGGTTTGTAYLKSMKLADYVAPVPEGAPTMSIFGEDVNYDWSNGLVFEKDTLQNGAGVVTNSMDKEIYITLAEQVEDFKLSYKFCNGTVTALDDDNVGAPVTAIMRKADNKAYTFGTSYWNAVGTGASDITFNYYDFDKYGLEGVEATSEGHRDQYGSNSGWHTVEIMMLDGRAVVIFDGMRWHDAEMAVEPVAGELALRIRFADTKIADLKVAKVTEADMARVVDIDFETSANGRFPLWFNGNGSAVTATHNASDGALAITNAWDDYELKVGSWASNNTMAENYTVEIEFRLDGITTTPSQRGIKFHLPSGNSVGLFGSEFRTAQKQYLTGYGSSYFTYKSADLMDGNYHTLKVVSKYGYEQIIVDGVILKTYEIASRVAGNFTWENIKNEGTAYLRSIKITDNTDIEDRQLYTEKTVTSSDITSDLRISTRSHGTVINGDSWVFSTRFRVNDLSACANNIVWLRLKTTDSGNTNAITIAIDKTQYYFGGGGGYGIKRITDDNGYVPHTIVQGQWVDVEVMVAGNYIIITIDGKTDIWYATLGIPADSATNDHIQLFKGYESIEFADTKYEYATEIGTAVKAIDELLDITVSDSGVASGAVNVTKDSGAAVIAADDAYSLLGAADRGYVYYSDKLSEAYNTYDALFETGDVTEDGNVNIIDLIRLKKIAAGTSERTVKSNVDGDSDKVIGADDNALLKKILLGVN